MSTARRVPIPFPLPEDLTGSKIGRFVIRSKLGSGGMGEVYYAEDTELQRPVALKRVARKVGRDPEARQRILREARRASTLASEHIASIHDVVEEDGELFLVMEYVEGATLRHSLHQPIDLARFFQIATQCAEGLTVAHEHGIVHCDIKPENIMLTPQGAVKILDFGLAKHVPSSSDGSTTESSVSLAGTPAYIAPEVLMEHFPDERTDVFSLGVVLYEMLTGRNPFQKGGLVATSDRTLHEEPTAIHALNSSVPQALEAVVMKAMAKPPAQRHANARQLLDELRQVQAGSVAGQAQSEKSWATRWKGRGLQVVAVGIAIIMASGGSRRPPIFAERGWVLIADFETSGEGFIPDQGVREGLTIALQQSRYVNIYPRARVYEVLHRMKKDGTQRIDEALGREICQRENLQVLLAGNIDRMGDAFQITVRVMDPSQGTLLFAEREQVNRADQFFEKADELAKSLRNRLGESLERIEKSSRPLARVTTTSLEALQFYSQAKDASDQGRNDQVPVLLKNALALDPDFAMAHLRLGQYYLAVVGKNEKGVKELERAYELRHGVTEREQYRIEAGYYGLLEQYEDEVRSLNILVGRYPDDEEAHQELAGAYYDTGQTEKAILELREVLRLHPSSAPAYRSLVLYLARNNQVHAAIAASQEAQQHGVDPPQMRWGLGLAYLAQGDILTARQEFERIGRATEAERELRDLNLVVADLHEGKLNSGKNRLVTQITAAPERGEGLQTIRRYLLGRIYLSQRHAGNAVAEADRILRVPSTGLQIFDLMNAGILYARGGQLGRARLLLRRLDGSRKSSPTAWNQSCFFNLEGEIWMAAGKPKEAEKSFALAAQEYPQFLSHMGLASAYQTQKRWDLAAREWERVLQSKGEILQDGYPPDLVNAQLQLARVYREMKNLDLSRSHYQEVLRQWQNADSHRWVADARRELKELIPESPLR